MIHDRNATKLEPALTRSTLWRGWQIYSRIGERARCFTHLRYAAHLSPEVLNTSGFQLVHSKGWMSGSSTENMGFEGCHQVSC